MACMFSVVGMMAEDYARATVVGKTYLRGFTYTLENLNDPELGAPDEYWFEISTSNSSTGASNSWTDPKRYDNIRDGRVTYIMSDGVQYVSCKGVLKWNGTEETVKRTAPLVYRRSNLRELEVVDLAMLQRGARLQIVVPEDDPTIGTVKRAVFKKQNSDNSEFKCDENLTAVVVDSNVDGESVGSSYWIPVLTVSYNSREFTYTGKAHGIHPMGIGKADFTQVGYRSVNACWMLKPDESWGAEPPVVKATYGTSNTKVLDYDKEKYIFGETVKTNSVEMATGLMPGQSFALSYTIKFSDGHDVWFPSILDRTQSLPCKVKVESTGPTTAAVNVDWSDSELDGKISDACICYYDKFDPLNIEKGKHTYYIKGLRPDTEYKPIVSMKYDGNTFTNNTFSFKTKSLTLETRTPKSYELGSAVLAAKTNIDSHETSAGFQYKRNDAPATMEPYTVMGVAFDETMQAVVENLVATSFYDVRAYYKSYTGEEYFGEWMTFDPQNVSNGAPEVHTYVAENITHESATLRGYVVAGSDAVTEQGFEYWVDKDASSQAMPRRVKGELGETITGEGQLMTARVEKLAENTGYAYRTYVLANGKMHYGETRRFKTTSITGVDSVAGSDVYPVAYYTTGGVRVENPETGLYIVVYSDNSRRLQQIVK